MSLELKSLKADIVARLRVDGWTVEKLAVAQVKTLIAYRGIGRAGAAKIIAEAAEMLNEQGLEDAGQLETEHYYQRSSPAKILEGWEDDDGLQIKAVALSSARALAALKGIGEALAMQLISKAQDLVNQRGLHQSHAVAPGGPVRKINAAFDERWLSGEVEPPVMSIRVRRNFEAAKREYEANNG